MNYWPIWIEFTPFSEILIKIVRIAHWQVIQSTKNTYLNAMQFLEYVAQSRIFHLNERVDPFGDGLDFVTRSWTSPTFPAHKLNKHLLVCNVPRLGNGLIMWPLNDPICVYAYHQLLRHAESGYVLYVVKSWPYFSLFCERLLNITYIIELRARFFQSEMENSYLFRWKSGHYDLINLNCGQVFGLSPKTN